MEFNIFLNTKFRCTHLVLQQIHEAGKWMYTQQIKAKEKHFQMDGLNLQNGSVLHQSNFHQFSEKG